MPIKKKMLTQKADLHKEALANTQVSNGKEVIKKGRPLEHSDKHLSMPEGTAPLLIAPAPALTVGISKGITKNMDNYESLRIDCWLTSDVIDEEPQETIKRLSAIIDETIQNEIDSVCGEDE